MLDTAGKILKRIIHGRIEKVTDRQLPDKQFGFRKGRSTLDAIDLVVKTAKEAISGKRWKNGEKEYCLVAVLEFKNAFNSVRWNRIMEALERMKEYGTEKGPKEYRVPVEYHKAQYLDHFCGT